MVSTFQQVQVQNGTGPGVRRSKRPLLACRTRCNVLWKPPKFGNKVKIGIKVQCGNKFANWCNVWSIEGVIVYGHVPECHVTFGRGRLHNVWWDPYIDHKTSWGTISNVPWHMPSWSKTTYIFIRHTPILNSKLFWLTDNVKVLYTCIAKVASDSQVKLWGGVTHWECVI